MTASDAEVGDYLGISVSVSGDTAIVGAHQNDDGGVSTGSAYIFVRGTDDSWSEQAKLTASDPAWYDYFGQSVSVSGDIAIVGAYGDDDGGSTAGSAYVFARDGDTWSEQAKLSADGTIDGYFGYTVAVSGDTAMAGAFGNAGSVTDSGAAYLYSCT